ncbi:MAG: DNA-binding protein [Saprospiraceae bacterium]|nr:DNA-binding protein [Saprospiraceae bacterium]
MNITFEELREIKHKLPSGSVKRIAKELNIEEQKVRNYFSAGRNGKGEVADIYLEQGPNGGIVHIEDTSILETAKRILAEGES